MKIVDFVKKNIVLTIAWVLAIVSMFFVPPSTEYVGYIDFRTLLLLWSLMAITQGLMKQGVFRIMAHQLVSVTSNERQLGLALVMACFFLSMIITNDVALITLVPFTIYIFYEKENKENLMLILVLQTVAANLGSMVTPIGNPQNLYLYNLSGMGAAEFMGLMFPYLLVSLAMVLAFCFFIKKGDQQKEGITISPKSVNRVKSPLATAIYFALMALAISVVLHITSVYLMTAITLVVVLIIDWKSIIKVDYTLLLTFIGFFIFVGNISNLHIVQETMSQVVAGREMAIGIVTSQVISNVPAALLLAQFTDNVEILIKSVNLGGLGTLIASMASLITFKYYINEEYSKKNRYLLLFTIVNVAFLVVLVAFDYIF